MREMYSDVVLKVPLPSDELPVGARGVVVHVHVQGDAYEVEFITPAGETIDVVTVTEEKLEPSPQRCRGGGRRPDIEMFYNPSGATARPTADDRLSTT